MRRSWSTTSGNARRNRPRRVQAGFRRLLNDRDGDIALGQNTHELVTRLLSALPLRARPRLVTSDGEFHTIRRQLDRLREEGLDIVKVAARPAETLADRLAERRRRQDRVCARLVGPLRDRGNRPGPRRHREACDSHGATLLVDAYHHLNVVPFDIRAAGLEQAFVTGGGYKYCQLGEGNSFLRVPSGCRLRPVLTGWFSEFSALQQRRRSSGVEYGDGAARFAGATYDPTSHYRAAAVFTFHTDQGLTPERLRQISRHQVGLLKDAFEALDIDAAVARVEPMPDDRRCRISRHSHRSCERPLPGSADTRRARRRPWRCLATGSRAVPQRRSASGNHSRVGKYAA